MNSICASLKGLLWNPFEPLKPCKSMICWFQARRGMGPGRRDPQRQGKFAPAAEATVRLTAAKIEISGCPALFTRYCEYPRGNRWSSYAESQHRIGELRWRTGGSG